MVSDGHKLDAGSRRTSCVVDGLRRMIVNGDLLPGQQIRQELMAERFGVSRLPVREALRQLTSEGLVSHTPNVGYVVVRLSQSEFDQIYMMRRLLETELLKSLPIPTAAQLADLVARNDAVVDAANRMDLVEMRERNHEFHFGIFRLSDYKLLISEIERLWIWASPYHSVYLISADSRQAVLDEHAAMLEALEVGDREQLVSLMDQHRHGSETQLGVMFGSGGPMARPLD